MVTLHELRQLLALRHEICSSEVKGPGQLGDKA